MLANLNLSQVIYDPYIFTHTSIDDFKETFISLVDRSKEQNPIYLDQLFNMPSYTSLPATTEPDQFLPVHGMFRLHAESDPNRIALSCAETGEQMTYGELDLGARVRAQSKYTMVWLHLIDSCSVCI